MEQNIDQTQPQCLHLTDYTPSDMFTQKLAKYKKEIHGEIVGEYMFKTFYGREAAIIINKVLWCAVRIIIDCDFQFESYLHPPVTYNSMPRNKDQCLAIKNNWIRYLTQEEELRNALQKKEITHEQLAKKNHTFELYNTKKILNRPDDYIKAGDHIVTRKTLKYTHHGVYIGNGMVVHYAEQDGKMRICKDPLDKFITESSFYVRKYAIQLRTSREIIQKAQNIADSQDQPEYSLVFHNCEHFATDMVMDCKMSEQVRLGVGIGAGVAVAGVAIGVAYLVTKNPLKLNISDSDNDEDD